MLLTNVEITKLRNDTSQLALFVLVRLLESIFFKEDFKIEIFPLNKGDTAFWCVFKILFICYYYNM